MHLDNDSDHDIDLTDEGEPQALFPPTVNDKATDI